MATEPSGEKVSETTTTTKKEPNARCESIKIQWMSAKTIFSIESAVVIVIFGRGV